MLSKIKIILIFLFIYSCQPIEIVEPIEIDNSKLKKISISAKDLLLNIKYNPIFSENNIEDQINNPPIEIITSWINENISNFGNENTFVINIIDASITKKEINNTDTKKYSEKTVFQYDVFFLIEYELLDDSGFLIANSTVESSRSTTSPKYISLNESELIINDVLYNALKDFTNETVTLLDVYMSGYLN